MNYVDNFVLFDESKERLDGLKIEIEQYLYINLKLSLREYDRFKKHSEVLDFLGYILHDGATKSSQQL